MLQVISQRIDQAVFLVFLARRILRFRNAIGIQNETLTRIQVEVTNVVLSLAEKAQRQSG